MTSPIRISEPILGKDIKTVISTTTAKEIQTVLESRSKILGKVRGYEFKGSSNFSKTTRFSSPIYDLSEIGRASDIEPYINQSVRKHREQIMKEGYVVSGSDDQMVSYVKKRLFEIAVVSGISTQQWLRDTVSNLVTYHNAFIIFRRDSERSSGRPIRFYGKELAPIAGIYVGDPTSMEVSVDKWGTPRKWRQFIEYSEYSDTEYDKQYNVEDVVHITVDKKTGFTFGTPFLLPVLDDIRALRKLEEIAVIVASKEAFPLYHYKVGSETRPAMVYEGGDNEVDVVLSSVAGLPSQGYIVTSERHEVKLVSKDGSALDLSPYLEYFESRVIAGLRLSPLDLGRGGTANRATAGTINKSLQDSAKDYQAVISDFITQYIILPLLLEGGFDVTEENLVTFSFPTIDKEEERAEQNNGLQLYLGNVITRNEFRKKYLNLSPMTEEDEQDTQAFRSNKYQKEILDVKSAQTSGTDRAVANAVSNRAQPTNQFGTKQTKTRSTANDFSSKIKERYTLLKSSLLNSITDNNLDSFLIEELFRDFVKNSIAISKDSILEKIEQGYQKARKQYEYRNPEKDYEFEEIGQRAIDRFLLNFVTKSYWKTINPYKDQIFNLIKGDSDGNIDLPKIITTLEVLNKSIINLINDQQITSERFGFIKFAKKIGSKTIEIVNPDNLEATTLDISELVYKNFIPTPENADHILAFS